MNRLALGVALALVAVLAGCATAPTETATTPAGNETFEVRMTGNSSATYVVSASLVADPFGKVTLSHANGTNRTVAVPERQGAFTYGPESGVTSVRTGDRVVGGVHFEGSPDFSVTANEVPATRNLVYTVREKGESVLLVWGLIRCDRHVSDLSLVTNESGIATVGFACEP